MDYVFIPREGDREQIQELSISYANLPDEEFISVFNAAARPGITGVHAQAVSLIAQHREFLKRFGESPIYVHSQNCIGLKQEHWPLNKYE